MTVNYGFMGAPTYRVADPNEIITNALDEPMSLASTLWDQTKGAVLTTPITGTVVREGYAYDPTAPGPTGDLGVISDYLERLASGGEALPRSKPLTQEEWKASPAYRDGIPFDADMTPARANALAELYDARKVREFYAEKRPVTSFIANFVGSVPDISNFVPIAGPAVRAAATLRAGRIAGSALVSMGEAAVTTAVTGALTAPVRSKFGDDVSWQAQVSDIAISALIGGAFGTLAGALGRRADTRMEALRQDAEARLGTLQRTQEARIVLNDAVQSLVMDGEVKLGGTSADIIRKASVESEKISSAWDTVRSNPNGPIRDPLVAIEPGDIERSILVRGQFRGVNGEAEIKSKGGFGLVKLIWGHGPESAKEPPEFQITKEDITDLPNILRRYEPNKVSADGTMREWRVQRNGRTIVYADRQFDGRGDHHVVTAYVQQPDRVGAFEPLSKEKPAATGSSSEASNPLGDTAQGLTSRTPAGRSLPAPVEIVPPEPFGNEGSKAAAEVSPRVGKPEDTKALAQQFGVDPATGDFAELAELDALRKEGRLTADDEAVMADADKTQAAADSYGEALRAAMGCLL